MKSNWAIRRLGLGTISVLALASCSMDMAEDPEQVEARSEGFSRLRPMPTATVAVSAPSTPPPAWVGSCSQTQPTYIVERETGGCNAVTTANGSWFGCDLMEGVSNGFCIYTWSAGKPSNADYLALEAVAARAMARPRIVADCSAEKAVCAMQPLSGGLDFDCDLNPRLCCEMRPACEWNETIQMCGCPHDFQPACGVCGFVINGKLNAVLDTAPAASNEYLVTSGNASWVVVAPEGSQTFAAPLPGASDSTNVVIRIVP